MNFLILQGDLIIQTLLSSKDLGKIHTKEVDIEQDGVKSTRTFWKTENLEDERKI